MRTEAGKMPECLIFLIRNGLGVSNDRFGFKPFFMSFLQTGVLSLFPALLPAVLPGGG